MRSGVFQERRAAVMAVDCSRWAAAIEVHSERTGPNGSQSGLGQDIGVAAQELYLNRKSRGSPASMDQFGNVPLKGSRTGNRLADTKKLRHAESEAAEFRQ
jgi:hypothetical protein